MAITRSGLVGIYMLNNSLLFQFKHGDHICLFYRNPEGLREVLTPYIADGLRQGERCFCAQTPDTIRRLINDLRFLGVDADAAIKRGALELHTVEETYMPNGTFEPSKMMDLLVRSIEDAWARGFTALRTAGELSWAAHGHTDCDQLLTYENCVDLCFPGKAVIGLCQYDISAFPPQFLNAVIDAHRLHMTDREPRSFHSGLSFRSGNYWAEIVADKLVVAPTYYYVVQRRRPSEIVGWGTAGTFESANQCAEELVRIGDN